MKRSLFILLLCFISFQLSAQTKETILGKWKIVKVQLHDILIDMENPGETKQHIAEKLEKVTGKKPDSAMINAAFAETIYGLATTLFEFKEDGKAIIHLGDQEEDKDHSGSYTIDYEKGLLITEYKGEDNEGLKRHVQFKFENGFLVFKFSEEESAEIKEMILKRI